MTESGKVHSNFTSIIIAIFQETVKHQSLQNCGGCLLFFLCYFMAHEHLLKEHTYLHVASGDTPILEYRRLRSYISKLVTSRFFRKWCSSGIVSALLLQRTTDFTGFFRTFRDIAVAHKKYFYHLINPIVNLRKIDIPHPLYHTQTIMTA